MDSTDLRFFEVVAETKNLTKAADALHTVQSNVTTRIRRLEEEFGTELLHRHSRGVSLTAAGEALVPYAIKVRQLMEDALNTVSAKPSRMIRGKLRIGSLETIAAVRLPSILMRFADVCPQVDVVLRTGTSRELRDQVLDHRLDGAFVGGRTGQTELSETEVWAEELVLVGPASFRGAGSLRRMNEVRVLVFRTGCSYRSYLEAFLANEGIGAIRQIELGTLEGILGCVSAGQGITLLPRKVVEGSTYRSKLSIHKLPTQHSTVPMVFVQRIEGYATQALTRFIEIASQEHSDRPRSQTGMRTSTPSVLTEDLPRSAAASGSTRD